jgi:putative sigma-54 modulation protein
MVAMKINITARHFDLTPALRTYIEESLNKLEKFSNHLIEAHVILDKEGYRNIAEVIVHVNRSTLTAKEASNDMYLAADGAANKLETQLKRYEERLKDERHREGSRTKDSQGRR